MGWIILIKTLNALWKVKHVTFVRRKIILQVNVVLRKNRQDLEQYIMLRAVKKAVTMRVKTFLFGLSCLNAMTSRPKIRIHVKGHPVNILIDTGSSTNVMDGSTYKSMKQQPKLCKSDTKVYAYGANEKVSLLGKFQALVETSDKITSAPFYVTKGKSRNLLSYIT